MCSTPAAIEMTEMLVIVLNIHSEDDDDKPPEAGGEGKKGWVSMRVSSGWV